MNFTAENPARILIVDDHAIVRYGMDVMLSGADDLSLCGEAETIDEALAAVAELKPDAAVIDIVLKNGSGLDLIRRIRSQESEAREQGAGSKSQSPGDDAPNNQQLTTNNSQSPDNQQPTTNNSPLNNQQRTTHNSQSPMPILVMSMHNESTHAEKALRAGAQGYIMKEDADEVLVEALRTVLSGKLHVSNEVHEKMLRTYIDGDGDPEQTGVESLTNREKEVLKGVGRGLTSKEIAEKFGLSPRTVEVHRANIKKKLECDNTAQLLRTAVQWVEEQ